jgi:tight adherence protein C
MIAVFVMVASLSLLLGLLVTRPTRIESRLQNVFGQSTDVLEQDGTTLVTKVVQSALPKMGQHFTPQDAREHHRLKTRLIQAGYYAPQAMALFMGLKIVLAIVPALLGFATGLAGWVPMNVALLIGGVAGGVGLLGPSFWLDWQKRKRQTAIRRSLPDLLDQIVICLDGGLSLAGAMRLVVGELQKAHLLLGSEMAIVRRQVQLGSSIDEALRNFGTRADLEEVRSLAATVQNAERFGGSMVKSLHTFADGLRFKRQQRAEELAQKAGTKVLFPTLLFIFPAIFLIILGPAVIQVMGLFSQM